MHSLYSYNHQYIFDKLIYFHYPRLNVSLFYFSLLNLLTYCSVRHLLCTVSQKTSVICGRHTV